MWPVSSTFLAALKSPVHTIRVRMKILDTNFNTIAEFHDVGDTSNGPEDILVDGSVDVDVTRLTRRTFTATMLNPDGIWSPAHDWSGTFYVNRLIRLYRGIDYGSGEELVPIGTFMIDHADVAVERSMSVVVLSGSDLWKKFGKSMFGAATSWDAGTLINDVIEDMCDGAGVRNRNLDPLTDRDLADRKLSKKLSVELGDNRGDALAKLCDDFAIDVYFDVMGRLTTQDFQTPEDRAVVYTLDPDQNNNLLTVKSSFTDDNLYNGVLVVGTADKNHVVTYRVRDINPASVTNINKLGERIFKYESDQIGSVSVARQTALRLFYAHVLVNDDITLETICNPAYEGNDILKVREMEFSQLNSQNLRIKAFTVPLSSSRQTIRLMRNINLT